jgi:hypothetical protein
MHGRPRMKRIVAFTLLLLAPRAAHACQCGHLPSPEEGLRVSEAVFEGRVIARRMVLGEEHGWLFPVPEYEFRVSRAWKGVATPAIRLLGGYSNCAYVFREGGSYLVFAAPHWEKPGRLSSSICSPTKPVKEAGATFAQNPDPGHAWIERLRADFVAGVAVFGNVPRHNDSEGPLSTFGLSAAILALLAAAGLIAALWSLRKRRRLLVLLIVTIALGMASLLVAGHQVYRFPWFGQYVE